MNGYLRWLGQKHIDLFGPSERAIAVRKWRMVQRAKKRRGETVSQFIPQMLLYSIHARISPHYDSITGSTDD